MQTPALDTVRLLKEFQQPLPKDFIAKKTGQTSVELSSVLSELEKRGILSISDNNVRLDAPSDR